MLQPRSSETAVRSIFVTSDWRAGLALSVLFVLSALPSHSSVPLGPEFLLPSLVLGAALVWLSVIDLRSFRLPDWLTLPLLAVGLILSFFLKWDELYWRILAAALGFILLYAVARLYYLLRGRHGLGLGDAKLLAASGAWLGIEGIPATLLLASCTALCAALASTLAGRSITADTRMPFGPFLAVGTWLTWFYGPLI